MKEVFSIESEDDLKEVLVGISKHLVPQEEGATVIGLVGELGAGKTTSAQLLGRYIGVVSTMQSPTFVIERVYPIAWNGFTTLAHLDMYRLSPGDLPSVKLHERLVDKQTLLIIEWADMIKDTLPKNTHWITITRTKDGAREVEYNHE